MQLKDRLVKIIELHGVLIDSIKVGNVSSTEEAVEELKTYTTSTYTPANQLAKAVLKVNGCGEGIGIIREVFIYLLEKHDRLRQVLTTLSEMTEQVPYPKLSDELLESYSQLRAVVAAITEQGNRGDIMVVDVVLTSLGMAEKQEEE